MNNVLLICILISLNAFFAALEFAIVSSRRARVDMLAGPQNEAGNLVRRWLEQPAARDHLISATQLGITLVNLALGSTGENAFEEWLAPVFSTVSLPSELSFLSQVLATLPLIISLIVVTFVTVVLGEMVPKVAVLRAPERYALLAAEPMNVFIIVFRWFINLLDWTTRNILILLGIPPASGHDTLASTEELRRIVSGPEMDGKIEEPEREMLSAILDFGTMLVRQVCVPRLQIIAVQADVSLSEIIRVASEKAITKMPVYEENLDQVIGIVHVLDVLNALHHQRQDVTARELARKPIFVPETSSVSDVLDQLRSHHTHMAIVLDEFGGTSGLITLEDLLEEIVGDVKGPLAAGPESLDIQRMPDGDLLLDGMALLEEVNQFFAGEGINLKLEDDNYDTIAGYVLGRLGRIPVAGDEIEDPASGFRFKVTRMDRLRIAQIIMTPLPPPPAS